VNRRRPREAGPIAQTVNIDNGLCLRRRHIRDGRNEDTTPAADHEIAGPSAEAVILYEGPVVRPNLEQSLGVGEHARTMAAAKRASACPQRIVFRRLGNSQSHMNVAAVASAQMVHTNEAMGQRVDIQLLCLPVAE